MSFLTIRGLCRETSLICVPVLSIVVCTGNKQRTQTILCAWVLNSGEHSTSSRRRRQKIRVVLRRPVGKLVWLVDSEMIYNPSFALSLEGVVIGNILLTSGIHGMSGSAKGAKVAKGAKGAKDATYCYRTKYTNELKRSNFWVVFLRMHKGVFTNRKVMLAEYRADFREKMIKRLEKLEDKSWTKKEKKAKYHKIICEHFYEEEKKSGKHSQHNKDVITTAVSKVLAKRSTRASMSAIKKIKPQSTKKARAVSRLKTGLRSPTKNNRQGGVVGRSGRSQVKRTQYDPTLGTGRTCLTKEKKVKSTRSSTTQREAKPGSNLKCMDHQRKVFKHMQKVSNDFQVTGADFAKT